MSFLKGSLNLAARPLRPAAALGRRLFANALLILGYHTVVDAPLDVPDPCFTLAGQFRREMRQLQALGYRFLPLLEAVRRLRGGGLGQPTVCVTFDDGLAGVHGSAFPVLEELGIPATVFLVTDLVDTADTLWYCRLHDALTRARSNQLSWDGRDYDLSSGPARRAASWELQGRLKQLDEPALVRALAAIFAELACPPEGDVPEDSPFRMLSAAQIARMAQSGLVAFGAHTARHTILTRTTRERSRVEIRRSLAAVAALTGEACRCFSYPNGKPGDYDGAALEALREAGVEAAVTTAIGWNRRSTPPLELRRVQVGEPADAPGFAWNTNPLRILIKWRGGRA